MLIECWFKSVNEKMIPVSNPFKVNDLLTTDVECSKWASEGLPQDELSIQNGMLTVNSSRFPLCIDPQMQAITWIKNREKANLKIKTFNDSDFMRHLKLAIKTGQTFLFENIDIDLDPIIDPILEKNFVIKAGQKVITVEGDEMDWDDNFKLFLTTKLGNPKYSPEIMGKTMIINYSVTLQGLRDQLLNIVVK